MTLADGMMMDGVEVTGEVKKQKLKKNKMNVEVNDDPGVSEEAFETRQEKWSVKEPPLPPSPWTVEEAEAESPEPPERSEFSRDAAANRSGRSKDAPSTWTPSLGYKGGSNTVTGEPGKASWSTQANWATQSSQSYSSTRRESYNQGYQNYGNQSYSSNGYQGTTSHVTAPSATSAATATTWKNWKSNDWWERSSRREASEEFADAVTVTKEGLMQIRLGNRGLNEEGVRRFCNWLPGYMKKQRMEETKLVQRNDCFLAQMLDASKNYMNSAALKMLLTVLKEQRIVLGVMNLHHNKLDRLAASMLSMWIRTCPLPLYELHLSHNEIDTEGALEIIEEVAKADSYPTDRPGIEKKKVPLWLRMEHNKLEESFAWKTEEIFWRHRKAGAAPHVCWLNQNEWGQCRSDFCCMSSQYKCPVVHLPYVKQHFLPNQQKENYWSSWNSGKAWRVRSNEEANTNSQSWQELGWQTWRPKTSAQGPAAAPAANSEGHGESSEACCETPDPTSEPDENAIHKAQSREVSVPVEERPWKEVFDEPADFSVDQVEEPEQPKATSPESPSAAKEDENAESLPDRACEGGPSSSSEEVLYDYRESIDSPAAATPSALGKDELEEPLPTPTERSAESPEKEKAEACTFSEERLPEGEDREVEGALIAEPVSNPSPVQEETREQEKEEVAGHFLPEETLSEGSQKRAPSPAPDVEPQEQEEEEVSGHFLPEESLQEDAGEQKGDLSTAPTNLEEVTESF